MKSNYILTGLAALILVAGASCTKMDRNDVVLSANLNLYKTIINCTYTDAATGLPAQIEAGSGMKVEVVNSVTGLVVDIASGKYQSVYRPNYPFATFGLNPYSQVPTKEKPVVLLVKTTHPAYLDNYTTITIFQESVETRNIQLISRTNPPEGVEITKFTNVVSVDASGSTTDSADVVSQSGKYIFHFSKGSILKDKDGRPLTGKLSVEMVTVDPSTEAGWPDVPGMNQPLITPDGKAGGLFSPISYCSVIISDQNGHIAATVAGEPLKYIAFTGASVKTSVDLIPNYALDPSSGGWLFNGYSTSFLGPTQGLGLVATAIAVPVAISHDHHSEPYLYVNVRVDLTGVTRQLNDPLNLRLIVNGESHLSQELYSGMLAISNYSTNTTIHLNPCFSNYSFKLSGAALKYSFLSIIKTNNELDIVGDVTFNLKDSDLFPSVSEGDTTQVYLQFACTPANENAIFLDSPNLPASFNLIISGTGFEGEKIFTVSNGSFEVPFNPMAQTGGSWQAKVVMGDMEYPEGEGRVTVTRDDFILNGDVLIFTYTPDTPGGCEELREKLGLK